MGGLGLKPTSFLPLALLPWLRCGAVACSEKELQSASLGGVGDLQQLLENCSIDVSRGSPQLDCEILVQLGCNYTVDTDSTNSALRRAALSLSCRNPGELTQPLLQLWSSCGGDIRWQDETGIPLLDLLQNPDARDFWIAYATVQATMVSTMTDWRAWLMPTLAALLAYAEVRLERKCLLRRSRHANGAEPFLEGAKLLVSQAFRKNGLVVKLWRFLEVGVGMFWLGFVLMLAHWAWWLPIAAAFYLGPAVMLHGMKELKPCAR